MLCRIIESCAHNRFLVFTCVLLLMLTNELSQLLGRKLFSTRVEQYEYPAAATGITTTRLQQRSFIFERNAFCVGELL